MEKLTSKPKTEMRIRVIKNAAAGKTTAPENITIETPRTMGKSVALLASAMIVEGMTLPTRSYVPSPRSVSQGLYDLMSKPVKNALRFGSAYSSYHSPKSREIARLERRDEMDRWSAQLNYDGWCNLA